LLRCEIRLPAIDHFEGFLPVGWWMVCGEPREGVSRKSLDINCY